LETPENSEVAGGAGIPFHHGNLQEKIEEVLAMPEHDRQLLQRRAEDRARERYSWETVTDAYEKLLSGMPHGR